MRIGTWKLGVEHVLIAIARGACSNGDTGAAPSSAASTVSASAVSAAQLGAVVCSDPPQRMGVDAEVYTAESWTCAHDGEHVRVDVYMDKTQQQGAAKILTDFYKSAGDNRSLGDLPLVCGTLWSIGVDSNTTRDQFIQALTTAGLAAQHC